MKDHTLAINRKVLTGAIVATSLTVLAVQQNGSTASSGTGGRHASKSSNTSIDLQSTSSTHNAGSAADLTETATDNTAAGNSASTQSRSELSVSVNGQSIAVPANGSTQQTLTNQDGTTTVVVSHDSSTSGGGTSTNVTATSTSSNSANPVGGAFFDPADLPDLDFDPADP